jgi:hypothetical protein
MPGPQHDLFAAYLAELSQNAERMPQLQRLIAAERRYYGWSFLPGPEGTRTEAAFASFAEAVQPSR